MDFFYGLFGSGGRRREGFDASGNANTDAVAQICESLGYVPSETILTGDGASIDTSGNITIRNVIIQPAYTKEYGDFLAIDDNSKLVFKRNNVDGYSTKWTIQQIQQNTVCIKNGDNAITVIAGELFMNPYQPSNPQNQLFALNQLVNNIPNYGTISTTTDNRFLRRGKSASASLNDATNQQAMNSVSVEDATVKIAKLEHCFAYNNTKSMKRIVPALTSVQPPAIPPLPDQPVLLASQLEGFVDSSSFSSWFYWLLFFIPLLVLVIAGIFIKENGRMELTKYFNRRRRRKGLLL